MARPDLAALDTASTGRRARVYRVAVCAPSNRAETSAKLALQLPRNGADQIGVTPVLKPFSLLADNWRSRSNNQSVVISSIRQQFSLCPDIIQQCRDLILNANAIIHANDT